MQSLIKAHRAITGTGCKAVLQSPYSHKQPSIINSLIKSLQRNPLFTQARFLPNQPGA